MKTILIENILILESAKSALIRLGEVDIIEANPSITNVILTDDVELLIISPEGYNYDVFTQLANEIKLVHKNMKVAALPLFCDAKSYQELLDNGFDMVIWKASTAMEIKNAFVHLKKGIKYFSKEKSDLN